MNKPLIRFKGFKDEWKYVELGEVLKERKIRKKISEETPLLAFAAGQGVIDKSERKTNNRDFLTNDFDNKIYLLTKYDDIVYNPSNLKYGAIDRNKFGTGLISPIYVTLTTSENPKFIEQVVKSDDFKYEALKFEEGTVVKRQSVSTENLLKIKVGIPTKEEQDIIGDFLENIDNKIALLNKKIELLENIKIQQIEDLYENCDGDYIEIKNLIDEYNEKTTKNNEYTVLSSTNKGIFIQEEYFSKKTASVDTTGYKIVPKNYITYRSMSDTGSFTFNIQNMIDKGIVSPAYPVFNVKDKINKIYFLNYLNYSFEFKKQILSSVEGGTRFALSITKLGKFKIKIPDYNVQEKIANFIIIMDKKIELEKELVNYMILLKKGFMQNMFV
ncbi:MAG: restriction endonuclease subunit S [bacterium]|nr:restriction endonuclease subunit S [bacterium]